LVADLGSVSNRMTKEEYLEVRLVLWAIVDVGPEDLILERRRLSCIR
jgi:hypothetical protein